MILVLGALAADLGSFGTLGGAPLEAAIQPDGAVLLSRGGTETTLKAPTGRCEAEVGRAVDGFWVRWICDAKMDRFGTITEASAAWSDRWTVNRQPPTEGLAWLRATVAKAAERDSTEARGLAARFASRLQYAAQMEDREAVLAPLLAGLVRENAADPDPEHAGNRTLDFLQSPPVWEPERPWDYGKRLRIGPPAGNRPVPERVAWLDATPENAATLRSLAATLHLAGHQGPAEELCDNVAKVLPTDGEAQLLLGDIRWSKGDREAAREAYQRAKALGVSLPRVDRRSQPG